MSGVLRTRLYTSTAPVGTSGGSSSGAANEIQKGDGTGGFSGTKIFSGADGDITLGEDTLAGATRTVGVAGSAADIALLLQGKGAGTVTLQSNAVQFVVEDGGGVAVLARARIVDAGLLVNGIGNTGATYSLRCENSDGAPALDVDNSLNINIGVVGYVAGPRGVVAIGNAGTVPAANAVDGGFLYAEGGALKYRGSAGTITTLGNA